MIFGTLIPQVGRIFSRGIRRMRFQRRGEPQVQGSNASSSSSSIEVRETSLITEDIELIEQSHTDTIEIDLMVKSGKWTGKYCQAIQQDTDEDVKSALFADLRLPLPNNLAAKFLKEKIIDKDHEVAFRLKNESIVGYVAYVAVTPKNAATPKNYCVTIVSVENKQESCVFIRDEEDTSKIKDKHTNRYLMVDEDSKIGTTSDPHNATEFYV